MRHHAVRSMLPLMAALAAVVALGPALPVLGQGVTPSAVPSAGPSSVPSVLPSTGPASLIPPPKVRLLDLGSRPRAVRRYAFQPGTVETMVMDLGQTVRTEIDGGVETEFALPTLRYSLAITIREVDEAGTATWEMEVAAVEAIGDAEAEEEVDPALITSLNEALAPMIGVRITATTDARGFSTALSTETSGMDPTLAQQVTALMEQSAQLALVLPEERVGDGARWVSENVASSNGLAFRSRQVVTLRRADGDVLTLAVEATQTGLPGPVALPGLPAGFTAELVELTGTTTARMTLDLGALVPRSRGEGTIRATLSASDGTATQTTVSRVESVINVRPGDAG